MYRKKLQFLSIMYWIIYINLYCNCINVNGRVDKEYFCKSFEIAVSDASNSEVYGDMNWRATDKTALDLVDRPFFSTEEGEGDTEKGLQARWKRKECKQRQLWIAMDRLRCVDVPKPWIKVLPTSPIPPHWRAFGERWQSVIKNMQSKCALRSAHHYITNNIQCSQSIPGHNKGHFGTSTWQHKWTNNGRQASTRAWW